MFNIFLNNTYHKINLLQLLLLLILSIIYYDQCNISSSEYCYTLYSIQNKQRIVNYAFVYKLNIFTHILETKMYNFMTLGLYNSMLNKTDKYIYLIINSNSS